MTDYAALVAELRYVDHDLMRHAADAIEELSKRPEKVYVGPNPSLVRACAERDAALARIAAVRALCDSIESRRNLSVYLDMFVDHILAALDGDQS